MQILIIRHCEPDYEHDTITEKGWKEAGLLAERLANIHIDTCYVSPLGRARDTASVYLEKTGATAEVCDWLKEFPPKINRPDDKTKRHIAWDWLPEDWMDIEEFYDRDQWYKHPVMQEAHVEETYKSVILSFDQFLEKHGYKREGRYYQAVRPNRDTIALFCHFGLEVVLLSHLMNVSPMPLWHHTCALSSSVSSLYTEERREGKAIFRMDYFGDITHLNAGGEKPSFSARFCETWDSMDERHD